MKNEKSNNKKMIVAIVIGVIVIIIAIIGISSINKRAIDSDVQNSDDLGFTKEFDDGISISGAVENIYKVEMTEIQEGTNAYSA